MIAHMIENLMTMLQLHFARHLAAPVQLLHCKHPKPANGV